MHAPPKVHFIIANGDTARCVERGESGFVTLHELHAHGHHHPAHAKRTVHESAAHGQHGANEEDVHARRREDFSKELADHINREAAAGVYQRLAIVAPAHVLGEVRKHVTPIAQKIWVAEIAKDLTKTPNHDLDAWLRHPDLA